MKGAIARAAGAGRRDAGQLDAAAVRESGQRRGPPPHHRAGDPGRLPRRADRRADHRRRHRRPHHRLRRGAEEGLAEPQGLRGRADAVAGDLRRPAGPAPDPGHRRRLHPGNPHTQLLDGVIQVDADDAKEMARRAAREEGMLVGIRPARRCRRSRRSCRSWRRAAAMLGFNYDTGERYLSVPDFLPEHRVEPADNRVFRSGFESERKTRGLATNARFQGGFMRSHAVRQYATETERPAPSPASFGDALLFDISDRTGQRRPDAGGTARRRLDLRAVGCSCWHLIIAGTCSFRITVTAPPAASLRSWCRWQRRSRGSTCIAGIVLRAAAAATCSAQRRQADVRAIS